MGARILITLGLKDLMKRNGIGAADLASLMKVSEKTVSRWRVGDYVPSDKGKWEELMIALNILREEGAPLITPNDVLVFSLTPEELEMIEEERRKRHSRA